MRRLLIHICYVAALISNCRPTASVLADRQHDSLLTSEAETLNTLDRRESVILNNAEFSSVPRKKPSRNLYRTAGNLQAKATTFNETLNQSYNIVRDGWSPWTQKSACSRTCGGGVEVWIRECEQQERGCFGQKEKFRICNKQRCPAGNDDFKALQCNRVGHKLQPSSGDWAPVVEDHRPCALTCRPPTSSKIEQLWEHVVDGTQCRSGTLDMCVRGKCMRVGCDTEIGSDLALDTCGVCGGDGASCQHANIYHWKTTGFSRCSETCGGGWQHTDAVCVYRINSGAAFELENQTTSSKASFDGSSSAPPVADQFCSGMRRPLVHSQRCNLHPCLPSSVNVVYAWTPDEWGPCTNSCGRGTHGRRVVCGRYIRHKPTNQQQLDNVADSDEKQNKFDTTRVEPVEHKYCRHSPRPPVSEACFETRGCTSGAMRDDVYALAPFRWSIGQWTSCAPVECGMGVRQRQVKCVAKNETHLANQASGTAAVLDAECEQYSPPDERKPHSKEHCYSDELCVTNGRRNPLSSAQQLEPSFTPSSHGPNVDEMNRIDTKLSNYRKLNNIAYMSRHASDDEIFMLPADQPPFNNNNILDDNVQALPLVSPYGGDAANQVTTLDKVDDDKKLTDQSDNNHVEFVAGPWSVCSHTCGDSGVMTRSVDCFIWLQRSLAVVKLSDAECDMQTNKPPTTQFCSNLPHCPDDEIANYNANDKSVIVGIYPTIDRGFSTSSGAATPQILPNPSKQQQQNWNDNQYTWQYLWTNCSRTCGGGVQTGRPYCMERSSHSPVEDERCLHGGLSKPPLTAERGCNEQSCQQLQEMQLDQPQWHLVSETACMPKPNNKKCNLNGFKKRKFVCIHGNSGKKLKKVDLELCRRRVGAMPAARIKCKVDENEFDLHDSCQKRRRQWRTGPWTECSSPCGSDSYRQRSVFCEERKPNGRTVVVPPNTQDETCGNDRKKPQANDLCENLPPCPLLRDDSNHDDAMHNSNLLLHDDDSVNQMDLPPLASEAAGKFHNKIIRLKLGTYRQRPDQRSFDMKIGETAYVYADTHLRLRCPVRKGYDKRGIRWLKDGQLLLTQRGRGHYRITRHGALKIRRLREVDQGTYTCIADKDRANSRIIVLHRAPLPFDDMVGQRPNNNDNNIAAENLPIMPSSGARWQLPPDKSWKPLPPMLMASPHHSPPYYYYGYGFYGGGKNQFQPPSPAAVDVDTNNDDTFRGQDEDVDTVSAIIRPRPIDTTPMPAVPTTTTAKLRARPAATTTTTAKSAPSSSDAELARISELRSALERSWSRALPPIDTSQARLELRGGGDNDGEPLQVQMILDERRGNMITFEWREGSWSECNSTCAKRGVETRPVYCLASQSGDMRAVQVVNTTLCNISGLRRRPDTHRICAQRAECPQWRAGQWSECLPERCFQLRLSQRERRIFCGFENGTRVDEMYCAVSDDDHNMEQQHNAKPSMTERCVLEQCEPTWQAMPWTPCSKTCGLAMRARNINCVWANTNMYAGDLCISLPQPATTEKCEDLPKCVEDNLCKDVSKFCGLAANLNLCTLHEYAVKCCKSCSLQQVKKRHFQQNELFHDSDDSTDDDDMFAPEHHFISARPKQPRAQLQESTLGSFSLRDAKHIQILNGARNDNYSDDEDDEDDLDDDQPNGTADDETKQRDSKTDNKRYFQQHIAEHVPDTQISRFRRD